MEIKTKFNLGETFYHLQDNHIVKDVVSYIHIFIDTHENTGESHITIEYYPKTSDFSLVIPPYCYKIDERDAFNSKEELVKALLKEEK